MWINIGMRNVGPDTFFSVGGKHMVIYEECEARKKTTEVVQVKTGNNISYAEAVKRCKNRKEKRR